MKLEQYSRLIQHRLTGEGAEFSIPTSNDHTDETWAASDLYIGEIGINVTDDRMFFRTNNGLVEVVTDGIGGTPSTPTQLWTLDTNEIRINDTLSPDAVVRNNTSYVDLGSSSLRFKDLYLGGATTSQATINVNGGFTLRDVNESIITTISSGSDKSSIVFATQSSNENRIRPLIINSKNSTIGEAGSQRGIINSTDSEIVGSDNVTIISGSGATVSSLAENTAYVGVGNGREYQYNNSLGVGGRIVLVGVNDDGTGCYNQSELVKGQARITTTDGLTNDLITFIWTGPSVIQFSAKVLGMSTTDVSLVYSNEIIVTAYTDGIDGYIVGEPIIKEVDNFYNLLDEKIELITTADDTEFALKVKGIASNSIQWLVSYEYQVLLNTN